MRGKSVRSGRSSSARKWRCNEIIRIKERFRRNCSYLCIACHPSCIGCHHVRQNSRKDSR